MYKGPGGHRHTVASIKFLEHAEGAAFDKCSVPPQQRCVTDDTRSPGSMFSPAGRGSLAPAQDAQTGEQGQADAFTEGSSASDTTARAVTMFVRFNMSPCIPDQPVTFNILPSG